MKTHYYLYSCILAASTLTLNACSDFLQEDPKGQLTPDTYYSSQKELDMSINALYTQVNHTQNYTNPLYPQWQGDDITANPGSNKQACAEMDKFAVSDNNKGNDTGTGAWMKSYTVIKAANSIVDKAGKTPTTQEEIDIAIAQAKFWRAVEYFYLVRLYGPLPLILHNENDNGKTPLTSVEGIYAQIVKDLEDCDALNLPTAYTKAPRNVKGCDVYITKQAVKSTLAAVYMAMAGYPLNLGTTYYEKAAAMAKDVIDNAATYGIRLDDNWADVYSMGNNYNKETILGINYSPVADWTNDSEFTSCNLFESLGGWGDGWGEIKFWKNFPEGPRKEYTYDPKIRLKDGTLVDWWATTDGQSVTATKDNAVVVEYHPMFSIFTVNKDADGSAIAAPYDYRLPKWGGMCNDHRHRLIRYAEVLLWYAESAARSGSDLTLAKECLKQVRSRAVNTSDVDVVDGVSIDAMTADQLAEAAWKEHGWEVAGYWPAMVTRRSDEFRLNRLKDNFEYRKTNAPIEVASGYYATESVAVSGTWSDALNYLPYPGSEVEKNPNLVR